MYILLPIIIIGLLIWAIIDYRKIDIELRRCPKCNHRVKRKFNIRFKYNANFSSFPSEPGKNLKATIYVCPNCGNSWNSSYESNEDTSNLS